MKQFSESAARNAPFIASALADILPETGLVLEIGSGTGQHADTFAREFPHLLWQPTNADDLQSILAWRAENGLPNFLEPLAFDLFDEAPPIPSADAVYSANVIHIAPSSAIPRFFKHSSALLQTGAPVILYGPFKYRSRELEPSNVSFDAWLHERFPDGGIREFESVCEIAKAEGFDFASDTEMPANNRLLVFRKAG
jgi:cyclopropane fatty-acyl-phospholipid synthase-like methyltransferase